MTQRQKAGLIPLLLPRKEKVRLVRVFMFVRTWVSVCVRGYLCVRAYVCIRVCTDVCTCEWVCTCVCVCFCVHMVSHLVRYFQLSTSTFELNHKIVQTHTHTHTHTQTHAHTCQVVKTAEMLPPLRRSRSPACTFTHIHTHSLSLTHTHTCVRCKRQQRCCRP